MSNDWYLMSSPTPLSGFEKSEFETYYNVFDEIISQSPEVYNVKVNETDKQVIIQSTDKDDEVKILANISDVKIGDVVFHKNEDWLVIEYPYDNKIYEKSLLKFCNNILKIQVGESGRTITGYTSIGQPIYSPSTPVYFEQSCCSINKSGTTYHTSFDDQINVPLGRSLILAPYRENANLVKEGMEFVMDNVQYKIIDVDTNRVKNNEGLLELFVEKIQSSSTT